MTPEEYIERYKEFVSDMVERDLPLVRGAQDTHAKVVTRIFVEGKNSSGTQIGTYNDTTPLYANPLTTPGKKFSPQGKGGKEAGFKVKSQSIKTQKEKVTLRGDLFQNGKKRKTKWFPSYKALKQEIGQESNFVTLEYTGDLKSDFSNNTTPVKLNDHSYGAGVRDKNAKKLEGLQDKYGSVVDWTKEESENFFSVSIKEFDLLLDKTLNA